MLPFWLLATREPELRQWGSMCLEEAYEAVECVKDGDLASLRDELDDVLLQVLFHTRIAAERAVGDGGFTIDDVADALAAKLIRRHPHVFGATAVSSADDLSRNWEDIKRAERSERSAATGGGAPSVLDGVAFGQPVLSLAAQLQRRADRAGCRGRLTGPKMSPAPVTRLPRRHRGRRAHEDRRASAGNRR